MTVRRVERAADDGYAHPLVTGLRSSADAERLADALVVSSARLARLASDPPGLYGEAAAATDREEATWLLFQIAYLGPLEGADPFASISATRTTWSSGELPSFDAAVPGPRGAIEPAARAVLAYREWATRGGGQLSALEGEPAWTPERRFARAFERLALPGLHHAARFDLLVTLGRLGVLEMRATTLGLGGSDEVTLAAKRIFGIGDTLLLERRAAELADATGLPLDALDLALESFGRGELLSGGVRRADLPAEASAQVAAALGVEAGSGTMQNMPCE